LQRAQATEKITAKFSSLRAFLSSPDVDAVSALPLLENEDIRLRQLPSFAAENLCQIGVKIGAADRIVTVAAKFLAE
jgi:hypothetical protein